MKSVDEDVMIFEIRLLREEQTRCRNLEQISHYLSLAYFLSRLLCAVSPSFLPFTLSRTDTRVITQIYIHSRTYSFEYLITLKTE